MRKRMVLALVLVAAMVLTSSCGLIVKDEAVDKQTVIVEVAGKTLTKGEVAESVEYNLAYQEYLYNYYYGMSFDRTDKAVISNIQDSVIEQFVRSAVTLQKQEGMGMMEFSAEELAEIETEVEQAYLSDVEYVKSSYFAETELTGEELDSAIAAKMTELGYSSTEDRMESQKATKGYEKLKAEIVKEVTLTDEELQTAYDEGVKAAQERYATALTNYASDVQGGETIYYVPAGYRNVKNILVKLSEEDSAAIADLKGQLSGKQNRLSNVETSLAGLKEDATQDTEEEAASRKELEETKGTLTTEIADLQTQLDAAKEAAYAKVQPKIDEILQKLAEGGDFDALMAEYGEDDGMKESPAKETGYLVCEGDTRWIAEFTEAAMALGKVGDVSAPVKTEYGIHLLQYASDVAEGVKTLDEVKESLSTELLAEKQGIFFEETVDQWVKDAGAKINKDRL